MQNGGDCDSNFTGMGLDLIKLLTADLMLSLCRVGDKTET